MKVTASIRRELGELFGGGNGPFLLTVAGGWGILLGTRMAYPVLLPYLRESFEMSLTVAGLLVTVLWLGSALGQLPGGILADRYSERLVMATGAILAAGALVLVVSAPTPAVLFLATGLVGLGQSLYPIARMTILSTIYPDRIGSALGVTMATGDLGQTVLPPIAGLLAASVAWQAGIGFLVPVLLVVALAIVVVLPDTGTAGSAGTGRSRERVREVREALSQENMVFVAFILFLFITTWQTFTGLYPTYLTEVKELSSPAAGVLFSLFFACGVLVKPVAGVAYDRIGMRTSLVVVLAGPIVGLGLLPFVEGFWPLAGVTAVVSSMLGSGAIIQSHLADRIPAAVQGTGLGVVRTITATLGATGPVLFGAVADAGYFDEGMLAIAAITALVVVLALRLPRR